MRADDSFFSHETDASIGQGRGLSPLTGHAPPVATKRAALANFGLAATFRRPRLEPRRRACSSRVPADRFWNDGRQQVVRKTSADPRDRLVFPGLTNDRAERRMIIHL